MNGANIVNIVNSKLANLNFARLNHILIPTTKEGRDRFRNTRAARLLFRPLAKTYFALTEEGRGLFGLALIASLMGLDVSRGQNYLLWSICFSVVVASLAVRPLLRLRGVRIEVEGPRRVSLGGEARFRVALASDGGPDHRSLRVRRPFLPWDGSWSESDTRPAELASGEVVTQSLTARFVARGHHHIDPFSVGALAPLGLVVGPEIDSRGTRFVVVPRIARVSRMEIPERPSYQQGGVKLASRTGESMELVGLRPYREGDRPRDLHARTWARLGTPMVREYQQEYFSRIAVALDCDVESSSEPLLEAAISLAAGVVEQLARADAIVDLMVLDDEGPKLTLGRSLGGIEQALDRLAEVKQARAFDAEVCFRAVHDELESLSAMVFVSLGWDAARQSWVERVRRSGVSCRVVVVGDAGEPAVEPAGDLGASFVSREAIDRACDGGPGISL